MLDTLTKLTKDVIKAAASLHEQEIRYLVSMYYQLQDYRIAASAQARTLTKSGQPNEVVSYIMHELGFLETEMKKVLMSYASNRLDGIWALSIPGIGPVIASGLLAHIDIEKAPTAGHVWSYAGVTGNDKWLGKVKATEIVNSVTKKHNKKYTEEFFIDLAKETGRNISYLKNSGKSKTGTYTDTSIKRACAMRPWNAELKTLVWKIGQSFVKVSNRDKDIYGKIYQERKAYEIAKNEAGEYAEQAKEKLDTVKIRDTTVAYSFYEKGLLPPGHIQQRAERYAAKIFLSHLHYVMYKVKYGKEPPAPFAISILGHAHEVPVPNRYIFDDVVMPESTLSLGDDFEESDNFS